MQVNDATITMGGLPARAVCDRKCSKAWGLSNRPTIEGSEQYLPDEDLGDAPIDPGTREGGTAKPLSPDEFPTKWCIRECERCALVYENEPFFKNGGGI